MSAVATPFPRRPIPVHGESIYGFERRFAACTRYQSLGAFRKATGLMEVVPGSTPRKFASMAELAGLAPEALASMRWTGRDGVRRGCSALIMGHLINASYLRTQTLRFCPDCLSEDGPPEQRIHHQAWQILQVCACPKHGTMLVEACDDCGRPIEQALKTKAWACACGKEMTDMAAASAPEGAVRMSELFTKRLLANPGQELKACDAGTVPEEFTALSLDALLTVISKIGMIASDDQDDEAVGLADRLYNGVAFNNTASCVDAARAMNAAYDVISTWPKGIEQIFTALADRNPSPPTKHPVHSIFATRLGYRLLGGIKTSDGESIRLIDDALGAWLFRERGIYIDARRRPKIAAAEDVAIDMADALRKLEGQAGHPLAIRTWAEAGAVQMIGGSVSLNSVDATVERIANLKCSHFDRGMSVEDWRSRFLYHKHYKRSDAIRDILRGDIRVRKATEDGLTGLASIMISADDFLERNRRAATSARTERRSLHRKLERAQKHDTFCRSGQLQALLDEKFKGLPVIDFAAEPTIRQRVDVRRYYGRQMIQNMYSIVDAMTYVQRTYRS